MSGLKKSGCQIVRKNGGKYGLRKDCSSEVKTKQIIQIQANLDVIGFGGSDVGDQYSKTAHK